MYVEGLEEQGWEGDGALDDATTARERAAVTGISETKLRQALEMGNEGYGLDALEGAGASSFPPPAAAAAPSYQAPAAATAAAAADAAIVESTPFAASDDDMKLGSSGGGAAEDSGFFSDNWDELLDLGC